MEPAKVVESKRSRGRPVIRIDREAERGLPLEVPRSELLPPEEGSYYEFQLVGLAVADEEGESLGRVTAVRPGDDVFTGKAVHEQRPNQIGGRAEDYDIDSQVPDPTGLNASFKFKFRNLAPINKVSAELMSKSSAR